MPRACGLALLVVLGALLAPGVLRAAPPNKPMILPTDGLFPAPTKADLRLRSDKRGHIHVEAVVEFCRARATERAVLPPRPTSAATTRATRG